MQLINTELLENLCEKAQTNPRLRMNHNFHSEPESPSQRLLNALEPGTDIPIHRHTATSETYVVLRGSVEVSFFDDSGNATQTAILSPKTASLGIHIPAGTWHGLEVLESGTVIFEVKDGPYTPISPENILTTAL